MRKSTQTAQLNAAFALAQGAYKQLVKNKIVNVKTRTGGSYTFSYADLGAVIASVKDALSANGLSYTQTLEQDNGGKYRLETTLWHSSGEFLMSETPLFVDEPGNQSFGSGLTFMKRYALCAMLGVAADDDDDANLAEGNEAKPVPKHRDALVEQVAAHNAPLPSGVKPNIVQTPSHPPPLDTGNPQVDGPHHIPAPPPPTPGGVHRDWPTWGKQFIDGVRLSADVKQVQTWKNLNDAALKAMEKEAPRTFSRLNDAIGLIEKSREVANAQQGSSQAG